MKKSESGDVGTEVMPLLKKEKKNKTGEGIRVMLPLAVSLKVFAALKELKMRKVDCKAEELLAEFLTTLSDKMLEEEIEKRTPEAYYLEAASQIPEIRAKLIEQAKRALLKQEEGPEKRTKNALKKSIVLQEHSDTLEGKESLESMDPAATH